MDSLTLKRHDSFRNKNNREATHFFAPRPLIFKLKTDVLKIQWYQRELELPKIWPGDKSLRLRKSKFWRRQFFSVVTSKWIFDISLLINLFAPLIELKRT